MKQKNVAIIRNAAPQDFGGGERFPVFLARVLTEGSYEPLVISRSESLLNFAGTQNIPSIKGWWLRKQSWAGMNIIFTPFYFVWQIILSLYYLQVFIRYNVDIVHIQSKDDFIGATIAAHVLGKSIIWTDHADLKHILLNTDRPLRNPTGKLVRYAMNYADVVTVVSKSELELVSRHLETSSQLQKKLIVIHNGAFDHFEHNVKQNEGTSIRILFAGRVVTDKGIGEAIEAMRQLKESHPHITLDVIGTGPEYDQYQSDAADLASISFHGHQEDPISWMKKADIFIQPTYHEGFSLVLVEASMMQLPIIATDVGGNPEIIINNETGLLIPAKDYEALKTAILRLAENHELRAKLSQAARKQYLEKFQFDRIVKEQFIPLYEKDID